MPNPINFWMEFDAAQPKRKRAELVCVQCHSKKIKCDLQARHGQGQGSCSNCHAADRDCQERSSKRPTHRREGQRRRRPATPPTPPPPPYPSLPDASAVDREQEPEPESEHESGPGRERQVHIDPGLDSIHIASPDVEDDGVPWVQPEDLVPSTAPEQQLENGISPCQRPTQSYQSHLSRQTHQDCVSVGSRTELISESQKGDIDTGFLQVWGRENEVDAQKQASEASARQNQVKVPSPQQPLRTHHSTSQEKQLLESFVETYWEYCYAWCPVLDRATVGEEMERSPLLTNALATAASHLQPPLIAHRGPAEYYKTARTIFYDDQEPNALTTLKSLALFYWWAPRSPTVVHRHSSWWWTSVLIRHAQQMNLHREPAPNSPMRTHLSLSLRRRIWWTAFARERLTALCQSKPAIIDQDDCTIQEPSLFDFPSDPESQRKGSVFIYWVRLCAIIGKVAKTLFRSGPSSDNHLQELANWVNSLPAYLQLQIGSSQTRHLDRDVYQLHLPYLTTVIILHLKRSEHSLPQALPPAILAASCIARILRDVLARGNARFLMAITCWYAGTAFIPLLQASRVSHFAQEASECLDILERTVDQLQSMWGTANVIRQGFERLRATASELPVPNTSAEGGLIQVQDRRQTSDTFDWTRLFPFATRDTNGIADRLLADREPGSMTEVHPPGDLLFHEMLMSQFDNIFVDTPDYNFDFMTNL